MGFMDSQNIEYVFIFATETQKAEACRLVMAWVAYCVSIPDVILFKN